MVEDMPAFIIDDVFPVSQIGNFFEEIKSQSFTREEYDFTGDEYPICSFDFDIKEFQTNNIVAHKVIELLSCLFPEEKHTLNRAYVNRCDNEDIEFPHRDCVDYSKNVTVIYYANNKWDYRWGGETKLYQDGDTRYAVLPKPGRILLFRGAIEHVGSIPTRLFTEKRYTLAMKFSSRTLIHSSSAPT